MKTFPAAFQRLVHSIRFRLVLWFALILALVLTIFSAFIYISQVRELRTELVARLQAKMESLEHTLSNYDFAANQGESDEQSTLTESDVLVLFDSHGETAFFQGPITETQITTLIQSRLSEPEEVILYSTLAEEDDKVDYGFMLSPRMSEERLSGFVLIGTPLDPGQRLKSLMVTLGIGSLATLVIALLGGFWLADRAMRPVANITQAARSISETDLSHRFHLKQQDEIGQLADTFDGMLARLEAAFERQRQFTADASHELRTPLTIVNLETSHALAAPRKPAEYQRALQIIHSENDTMSHLVNDLLTLARMDAGQTVPAREPLDLGDLALEVIERLSPLAARNQVTLEAGDLPETPILGDRQYLTQMLTNLIENAIKYTAHAGADRERMVHIETGSDSVRTLGWVCITDSGPGIPAEHLPHLFDRFYRVDKARTRSSDDASESPSGSGLGLAIVQWIAHTHGGNVQVESQLENGTSFTVQLPLDSPRAR